MSPFDFFGAAFAMKNGAGSAAFLWLSFFPFPFHFFDHRPTDTISTPSNNRTNTPGECGEPLPFQLMRI